MSKYDKLRSAFSDYKEAEHQYTQENENLARLIVDGLREYLDMPNSYESFSNGTISFESYTPFYKLDEDGNTKEAQFPRALSHFSDGSFRFAFGVILERAEGAYPKQNLILKVKCKRDGETAHLDITDRSIEVQFDGTDCPDIQQVHDLIFSQVLEWLKHRPGDGHGFSKFGFAVP